MREPDPMLVAVRAYAPPPSNSRPRKQKGKSNEAPRKKRPWTPDARRQPPAILVLDTETTVDAAQALIVGVYRYYRISWEAEGPKLSCLEEGLFHADDLAENDRAAFALLQHYRAQAQAAVDEDEDAHGSLRLLNRTEFVREVLLGALDAQATVVGFNLPFDLARVALDWGVAEADRFAGGFSFLLDEYLDEAGARHPNTALPRVLVRSFDSRRARIALGGVRPGSDPYAGVRGGGAFLDLRLLTQALSGETYSLERACAEFGVPYRKRRVELGKLSKRLVDYCRADVVATAALYEVLASEYERWHLQLAPTRAYSGASLAKAIVREAGIGPVSRRQRNPFESAIGYAMSAYFGGRSEVRVRRHPVPVATLDFRSMHPTVAVLMRLSRFLTCERLELERLGRTEIAELQAWLERVTIADCLKPGFWRKLDTFVLVKPEGDILPVRARYSPWGSYAIGVNPLWSDEPLWFTLADVVAAKLLGGRAPRILRAFRFVPHRALKGTRPLRIRDARPIDPRREDVYKALVEERRRLESQGAEGERTAAALKVVANSLSYGIWAELNRQEPKAKPTRLPVNGLVRFYADVHALEELGEYFFAPFAALVGGGARLMLAILERLVADAGGTWATCDTDGAALVATREASLVPCPGGPERDEAGRECVRALAWAQVDEIVERFAPLNPYDRDLVPGSILSLEPENFDPRGGRRELSCYAITPKRFCLYTLGKSGRPNVVRASAHALGGIYLDPRNPESASQEWVAEAWEWIVAEDALGLDVPEPVWLDRPALSRFTASHPRLLKPFAQLNRGRSYAEQAKPYGFLLVAHAALGGTRATSLDAPVPVLVAPYERDPERWSALPWRDLHDSKGGSYTLTSSVLDRGGYSLASDEVAAMSYRDVLRRFRVRPDPKCDDHRGRSCGRGTRGLLQRRPVRALAPIAYLGKETNFLDEVAAGIVTRETEATTVYVDCSRRSSGGWNEDWRRVLKEMKVRETAAAVGVNPTTITRIRAGAKPHSTLERKLMRVIGRFARARLREGGVDLALDDESAVRLYLCVASKAAQQRTWTSPTPRLVGAGLVG